MSKAMNKKQVVETLQETSGEVAVVENSAVAKNVYSLPGGFKLKKVLTLPSLVLKHVGVGYALRFDSELRTSKVPGKLKKDGTYEDPATVCEVTMLETGEKRILLAPAVVIKNLRDEYPENSYVGKSFYIQNMGKTKEGQRHIDYGIAEIE